MCGICGVLGRVDTATLARMRDRMVHRGPDDAGLYVDERVGLAVRRLSIIDLRGGHQPISNEDGTVWVVFNGEIYNYQELRRWLEGRGHRFHSKSDTEILVHGYEEYGEAVVHLLRGMFAFAVWDENHGRLFLARDRLGKKPLYFWQGNGNLVFASEIKAILEYPPVSRVVDEEGLQLYLAFGYVPAPRTMFDGISKLPSGHYLVADGSGVKVTQYWDAVFLDPPRQVSTRDAVEEIRWRLQEAVRLRLIADVPLGALLSGGLDSAAIVALMAEASSKPVKTFTVGFDAGGWFNEFDEARLVARRYQTEHQETVLAAPNVPDLLAKVLWHLDEPVADPAALPTYLICETARRHVTVVLTGEGGDELFGGYPRYGWFRMARRLAAWSPSPLRSTLARAAAILPPRYSLRWRGDVMLRDAPDEERHLEWVGALRRQERAALFERGLRPEPERLVAAYLDGAPRDSATGRSPLAGSLLHRLMYLDVKTWLVDDILMKVDKMSMAASLEARAPFLDHRLIEFIATLPENLKVRHLGTKWLLKRAFKVILPEQILQRRKHAFNVPTRQWLRGELKAYMKARLLEPTAAVGRYINGERVRHLVKEHMDGRANHERALWTLLCFEEWHRIFMDREQAS